MSKEKLFIVFFSVLTLQCPSAMAQIAYEPTWSPPDLMALNNIKFNPVVNGVIENGRNQNRENSDSALTQRTPVSTSFTPSLSVRKKNLSKFVTKTRATNPSGASDMEQLFASTDIIGQISNAMGTVGLESNDAADAFALYWISAWKATRGDNSSADSGTYQAVSAQAARGLSTSAEFANATEAQKQEMAEALMVQAAMIDAHMESAAGDAQQLQAVAKAVSQGAKASGLELNKMELTAQGFAKADKTGAADSADKATNPAADPKALAANTAPTDTGKSDTGKWAIIAAAGGAGLAGVFMLGKAMGKKG